jgi:glutamate transport system permease protein
MTAFINNIDVFWHGILTTLALSALSIAGALPLGILVAVFRVSPVGGFRLLSAIYVEIVRNTPLPVVFFFSAFVLPQFGVHFSFFTFAVIALIAYYVPLFCEAIRSGINAVSVGQAEAARSIGLPYSDCLRFVILPQALRNCIPPLVNVVIALIKNTALASAFGVAESLAAMEQVANQESSAVISVLIATALIYLAATIPLGLFASYVERRARFTQ